MKKHIYLLSLFLLIGCFTKAVSQQINISGRIIDFQFNPIEYASVRLLTEDSVFIKGTTSGPKGIIKLKAEKNKSYQLVLSVMGYLPVVIHLKETRESLSLGDVMMEQAAIDLDSVTITANRVVQQIDRQITYPSPLVRKSSNSALELLYKMALPRVLVNTTNKSVSLNGNESIKLRINGIDADINQVVAIPAGEITRIDYYDNPGVRVKESAMIDFIVRRRLSGGYVSTDLTNSPHIGFGDDMFAVKSNYKNSEWAAFYNLSYRGYKKRETPATTEFGFPGESFIQQTVGIPSSFNYQTNDLNLNYNYTLTDKRVINVTFGTSFHHNKGHDRFVNYYSDIPDVQFPSKIETRSQVKNPVLDIYYKETLSKNQALFFNVVTGYINTDYSRDYRERDDMNGQEAVFNSQITGKKYSVIGEGDHQVRWKNISLYSGVKYTLGYTKNNYEGDIVENTSLTNGDLYLYSQLQGKFKKMSYTAGIGVSYSYFDGQDNNFKFWTFRPSLSLGFLATNHFYIKYKFSVNQSTPSLSQLNDVSQMIDQYRIVKGNPDLKPYRIYSNSLQFTYQKNSLQIYLGSSHQFYSKVIMSEIGLAPSEKQIILTSSNQKYFQTINTFGGANFEIIKNILSVNLYAQLNWYDSKGNDYHHRYKCVCGGGQLNFNLKQWRANLGINSRNNYLWGETISYGEWGSVAEVGYKVKQLYLGVKAINFLTNKWSAGNKSLSRFMQGTSWTYIYDSAPIFCLNLSWNFNWGKKSNAENKTLQNKDSDSGILKAN